MNSNKKIYIIAGVVVLILAGSLFLFFNNEHLKDNLQKEQATEIKELYLKPDQGLNMEFTTPEELGFTVEGGKDEARERLIFERYRFYDTETNKPIDIRADGVRAFVKHYRGQEREITMDNIFYGMHIYPNPVGGEYGFRVEMPGSVEYRGSLEFPQPQLSELVFKEEITDEDGTALQVVSMEGVNLADAEPVYHLLPDSTFSYYTPDAEGNFLVESNIINNNSHLFLAKVNDAWYYVNHFHPEE